MTEPTLDVRPEVRSFVDLVRIYLGDLDDDVRDELTDGLEADLGDLVTERGVAALPDPEQYADELWVSAGLPIRVRHRLRRPRGSLRRPGRTWAETVDCWLDAARDRWLRWASLGPRAAAWELLQVLRPAWWVLRAWVAVVTVDLLTGRSEMIDLVPQFGVPLLGPAILAAAVVASVQVGRCGWWPGSAVAGSTRARLVLLAVNGAALVFAPALLSRAADAHVVYQYAGSRPAPTRDGIVSDGHAVKNVYAFDSSGRPLQGVQLFDQNGDPLAVNPGNAQGRSGHNRWWVAYPWWNGGQALWNVFPLPTREQVTARRDPSAWDSDSPPTVAEPPIAGTARATLPSPGASTDSEKPTSR